MSSYLAAATLNMANGVVKTLDQQLRIGDASRYQGDIAKLGSGLPVASVSLTEIMTGFNYGALEYKLVLGVPDKVLKQVTFTRDAFSGIHVLDFKRAYSISFMPQISLGFPPTYSGKQMAEEIAEDKRFSSTFIQPSEVINATLAEVAKYLNVSLEKGVVMQPGYDFGPVTVVVHKRNSDGDGAQRGSRNETRLFQLSQSGLSQFEGICKRSWRQTAAS